MSELDVVRLLSQMRAMAQVAQGKPVQATVEDTQSPDFALLLKQSVEKVNAAQHEAKHLARAFELGDPNVTLPEVMVAAQKASVSFQAMTEVRNKLLNAYQDIMSMQI